MAFTPAVVVLQVAHEEVERWDPVKPPKPRGTHRDLVVWNEAESLF